MSDLGRQVVLRHQPRQGRHHNAGQKLHAILSQQRNGPAATICTATTAGATTVIWSVLIRTAQHQTVDTTITREIITRQGPTSSRTILTATNKNTTTKVVTIKVVVGGHALGHEFATLIGVLSFRTNGRHRWSCRGWCDRRTSATNGTVCAIRLDTRALGIALDKARSFGCCRGASADLQKVIFRLDGAPNIAFLVSCGLTITRINVAKFFVAIDTARTGIDTSKATACRDLKKSGCGENLIFPDWLRLGDSDAWDQKKRSCHCRQQS